MTNMKGQWRGEFTSERGNTALLVLNIEDSEPLKGRVSLAWNYGSKSEIIPCFHAEILPDSHHRDSFIHIKLNNFIFFYFFFDSNYPMWRVIPWPCSIKLDYSGNIQGCLSELNFSGCCEINFGIKGTCSLKSTDVEKKTDAEKQNVSWNEFKIWADEQIHSERNKTEWLFRGQKEADKKLRTSFHRAGRNDLIRYHADMRLLAHHINAASSYIYDLKEMEDVGALLNLGQHYGFPTPFLDWTESPYIAAYFAFEGIEEEDIKKSKQVRIFAFNRTAWERDNLASFGFHDPRPAITVRIPAIRAGNDRPLSQQSIVTYSNVDDIEEFIKERQSEKNPKEDYIIRFDLPACMKKHVMKELRLMGIHAGSLFPGMEGICKSLKEKYFSD